MKLFIVDCVSSHRVSYVVRCKNEDHAADTVIMQEAQEFSQEHITEDITRIREITEEEYLKIFDKDNAYLKSWDDEQKKSLIHNVEYNDSDKYDPFLTASITL